MKSSSPIKIPSTEEDEEEPPPLVCKARGLHSPQDHSQGLEEAQEVPITAEEE